MSPRRTSGDPVLWWLAGDDPAALLAALDERAPTLAGGDTPRLVTAGAGPARLGLVDPDERKVKLARRLVAKGEPWRGRSDIWFTPAGLAGRGGKVVFLFPGVEPGFEVAGVDLPALAGPLGLDAPTIENDTVAHHGVSVYRLGIFVDRALRRLGVAPDLVAGHSVGEWAGTVAAGIVPTERASDLVAAQELDTIDLPDVDFAALAAGVATVGPIVADIPTVVISHDNAPNQSIICGLPDQVAVALARLRESNILGYTLPFQSGFHTPAIASAIETMRDQAELLPFGPATIPMWSATVVGPYPATRPELIDLHMRHLVEPVRFRPLVERLYREAGARIFVQAGIGSLTGFVDDTLGALDGAEHLSVPVLSGKRSAVAQVQRALTALWVEGLDVSAEALRAGAPDGSAAAEPPARAQPAAAAEPTAAADALAELAGTAEPPAHAQPAAHADPAAQADGMAATAAAGATAGAAAGPPAHHDPDALAAAAELLSAAATACRDVLGALMVRMSPGQRAGAGALATRHAAAPPAPVRLAVPPAAAPPAPAVERAPAPAPAPAPREPAPSRWPTGKVTLTRHLSIESMPETLDHTIYPQPPDWPDVSDRFPIVAMTTQIQLLQDITAELTGGRHVVEVFGIRNFRWLDLSDPLDLKITITPKSDDVLTISLGGYCRANLRVGDFETPPEHDPPPLTNERPTQHTAQDLWDLRLMFHGPLFQGIDAMGPIGDNGMHGQFTHLDTPGSLLDNLGKLIAYWVIDKGGIGEGALPVGVERIRFHGPPPQPGTKIHCDIRVLELQRDLVRADGVLVLPDGTEWCRVDGWASLVFHLDEQLEPLYHAPDRFQAVEPQPGGWHVVRERWPTGPGRDLTARRFTNRAERRTYDGLNLVEQRRWLLETIAAKDAVRHWLGTVHGISAYPVEVSLEPDGDRRFRPVSRVIPAGADPRVTLATPPLTPDTIAVTVAVVGDGEYRDIEVRQVPEGGDAEAAASEAAAALAARNPGARTASTPRPEHVVPSTLVDVPEPPPFAVAWTEAT